MSSDHPAPPPLPGSGGVGHDGADGRDTHAMFQRTEQTRTYPCGTCGGQLEFHIGQQQLVCPHCGNTQALVESTGTVEERDLHAAIAALHQRAAEAQQLVSGEKEVVCQNCGGHTTFTGTLTSTRCPYCATPIQRDDVHDAPARISVDGVLPFRLDRKQAEEALVKWVNSRWFAPNEFKTYNRTGAFNSVYCAYFTYDADTTTHYRGERGDDYTVTVGEGDNRRTETRTRWRRVSGRVSNTFDDVTVFANEGLDRRKVRALEPWPTHEVRPFSPEYLAGHLTRTYDHDVEECFDEAKERMEREIESTVRRDIGGDHQRIHSLQTTWRGLTYKHLLLPIWLLTVIYAGRPFQVMINGVTGEVHGERPWSKAKLITAIVVAIVVIGIALAIWGSVRS